MRPMTLGERIKKALDGSKLSVKDAAKKIGVGHSAIYPWLNDKTKNLKLENLFALADATGFSARWIATERGPEKISPQNNDLDLSFLTEVIHEVEIYLANKRVLLDAEKKAKLITLLYEIYVGRGQVEPPAIARYLRLVV